MPKFIRRNWTKASRLGKGRKNKQVWRRAKGRHNKVREKRKGYPIKVMVGFRKKKEERNLIDGKKPILVNNVNGLERIKNGEIAIIGNIGNKKKVEIIKRAKEKKILVYNLNVNKILRKLRKKKKEKHRRRKNEPKKEKGIGCKNFWSWTSKN